MAASEEAVRASERAIEADRKASIALTKIEDLEKTFIMQWEEVNRRAATQSKLQFFQLSVMVAVLGVLLSDKIGV